MHTSEFSQICASQNDLFALDKAGVVYRYNFTAKVWEPLGASRSQEERGDRGKRNGAPAGVVIVLVLTALLALVTARPAAGEVPTPADFAACNEQAPQAIRAGDATPTTRDHLRADRARGGSAATNSLTSTAVAWPDPQIHGMDAVGAKNAEYQAAYRSCMRRKGF